MMRRKDSSIKAKFGAKIKDEIIILEVKYPKRWIDGKWKNPPKDYIYIPLDQWKKVELYRNTHYNFSSKVLTFLSHYLSPLAGPNEQLGSMWIDVCLHAGKTITKAYLEVYEHEEI